MLKVASSRKQVALLATACLAPAESMLLSSHCSTSATPSTQWAPLVAHTTSLIEAALLARTHSARGGLVVRLAERGGGVVQLHEHLHVQRQARAAVVRVHVQRQPRQRVVALQDVSANMGTL